MFKKYSIGIDFGTNSVRTLIVDISNGKEIGTYVFNYEKGENGIILDKKNPLVARQHPADYLKGLEVSIIGALKQSDKVKGFKRSDVIGLGVDTTGSTPMPVDEKGIPLALKKEFKNNINALSWLWKDHSSYKEAQEITELAIKRGEPYLNKCGGVYSSEWFFSKILYCLKKDSKVFDSAYTWVELADFIPAVLTGVQKPEEIKRSICAAGHKAMFNSNIYLSKGL
ncbi:MAG: FGGY family carbohydrate kinase [Candidatus Firestonebacteria bacterium]